MDGKRLQAHHPPVSAPVPSVPPASDLPEAPAPDPFRADEKPARRWHAPFFKEWERLRDVFFAVPGARRALRATMLVVHGFRGETISLRASALTYLTLFALVPLLAVVYSVLDLFGDQDSLKSSMESWLSEQLGAGAGVAVEARLQDFTSKANVKTLGLIGFAFLLFSIISLLWNIESAFNHIYMVKRPRKLLDRLLKYWSFLTLGPFFIAGSLGLTWKISSLQKFHAAHAQAGHSEVLHFFTALSSIAITYAALMLLYKILPNARVPLTNAFGAAFIAGTAWEIAKFIFALISTRMIGVHKIYGSLAVLPIMLTWVYISWMITLGGCRLCFAFEASRKGPQHPLLQGAASREALTARTALELIRIHRDRNRPVRPIWIAQELDVPKRLVIEALRALAQAGLVAETTQRRWLPAKDPTTVTLADLRTAARLTLGYPQHEVDPLGEPLVRAWRQAESAASAQLGETVDAFLAKHDLTEEERETEREAQQEAERRKLIDSQPGAHPLRRSRA